MLTSGPTNSWEQTGPTAAGAGAPQRGDEDERRGCCTLLLAVEPKRGWRQVAVTECRTVQDSAWQLKALADDLVPQAEVIRVVLDNRDIHTPAALYRTFPPEEARRIARKVEFPAPPNHGSWLNMVESECSVLSRRCLTRRLPHVDQVRLEVTAWAERRKEANATVDWRFTTSHARRKLHRLYRQ
jgi:hypothetical protein